MSTSETQAHLDEFLGREPAWRWGRTVKLVLLVLALAGAGVLLWWLRSGNARAEYSFIKARRGDLSVSVSAIGNLVPTNQITVGSQISGLVTQVLVDVNDRVIAGQPIALLDTRRLRDTLRVDMANVEQSLASVAQQQATFAEARAQLARLVEVDTLSGGKVPAASEMSAQRATVLRAQAGVRLAQAQVNAARAQLSSNRTQLGFAVIRSPVAGVILSRQIEPGQTVVASFNTPTLFTVAEDLSNMKLDIAVDEADVGQLRAGQLGTFAVDAFPQRRFRAAVRRVNLGATTSATSGGKVVSYVAALNVRNDDLSLRPGMTANVKIETEKFSNAMLVPNAALRFAPGPARQAAKVQDDIKFTLPGATRQEKIGRSFADGGQQTVYKMSMDGQPQAISIKAGPSDGAWTVVLSGRIGLGDRLITGQNSQAAE